ncbi:MAG: glycosyltransferase N-terminal domain-containing protein [Pseudomonadota bacterium]
MTASLLTYRAITAALSPGIKFWLWGRGLRGKEDRHRRQERWGYASLARQPGMLIWLHAASVGEAKLAFTVIDSLAQGLGKKTATFLLTTGTVSSAELARQAFAGHEDRYHQYVPIDTPAATRRFIDHWRPDAAVWIESEFWPNLLDQSRHIPRAIINARMGATSYQRWRRTGGLFINLLKEVRLIWPADQDSAQRFEGLGLNVLHPVMNLKQAAVPTPPDKALLERYREVWLGRPVWTALSIHPPEIGLCLYAHRKAWATDPRTLTILCPRHPRLVRSISKTLAQYDIPFAKRSDHTDPGDAPVFIWDVIGEVDTLLALSHVVFIGGSMFDHGGQNPLEAAHRGLPVLFGPDMANFADLRDGLLKLKAAHTVQSKQDLAREVCDLLRDAPRRHTMGLAGRDYGTEQREGLSERIATKLLDTLDIAP